MRTVTLEAYDFNTVFIPGTKLEPDMGATSEGRVIAHDIIEHVNGIHEIGTIHDELQALGGIIFVRSVDGIDVSPDLEGLWNYYLDGVPLRQTLNRSREVLGDEHIEVDLEKAKQDSRLDLEPEELGKMNWFFEQAWHHMRVGYAKSVRRWKDENLRALDNFFAIEQTVNQIVKQIEYPGQQFKLTWGGRKATWRTGDDD